jgi:hypothetical protein
MNSLSSRTDLDPHSRRLQVDEAEWRDRLNQLADMRRTLFATPIATDAAVVAAPAQRVPQRVGEPLASSL